MSVVHSCSALRLKTGWNESQVTPGKSHGEETASLKVWPDGTVPLGPCHMMRTVFRLQSADERDKRLSANQTVPCLASTFQLTHKAFAETWSVPANMENPLDKTAKRRE